MTGFPVEGSGPADMADMDAGRNPELVVPYRDNAIRVGLLSLKGLSAETRARIVAGRHHHPGGRVGL